jgi:4-alpha-glucanotransferase
VLDASVGAPPDALAPEGQDWDLPPYRWDALAKKDYHWLKGRARRMAELYDVYRVDHVVGFYRTYVIPRGSGPKEGKFFPAAQPEQTKQAERVLEIMASAGAELIAEDLGTIPDFVRASLDKLKIPGYRVLRWERKWNAPGQPFIDPKTWPARSVATSGTHDTSTLAEWWEKELQPHDRREVLKLPAMCGIAETDQYTPQIRDALLEALLASASDLVILPIQDILGAREQVNVPGTVSPTNWTYRLPFTLEDWPQDEALAKRFSDVAWLARRHGRG